ncbi:DUF2282 domain-containing protein [Acidocella sp. KAb 2-4]|uniref:BufA1 family periplasmic bufferin-type metallophore n=1 Tax=Acidocella sp. KAb 2-4 TaxID=2885158 RepID=UPI001D05CEB2|nr:DUF2282 domain-containing protein [Acidocella sp. KAb 2-4]MCB5944668.1 DUF2282 domain-containing protein [Acidocella sp. KAb 2-4]
MERRNFAAKILAAAAGIAAVATPIAANAQTSGAKLEKCYGINAIGRNDCAAGTHSCAGQATMARDPASFVLLPTGDCSKIAGGSLTPGKAS